MAKLSIFTYIIGAPILLDLVDSETTQAVLLWAVALAVGFVVGHAKPERGSAGAMVTGTTVGLVSYLTILAYSVFLYDVDLGPQLGVWFLRFAVAGALAVIGGAMLGAKSNSAALVAVLEIASILVGIATGQ